MGNGTNRKKNGVERLLESEELDEYGKSSFYIETTG